MSARPRLTGAILAATFAMGMTADVLPQRADVQLLVGRTVRWSTDPPNAGTFSHSGVFTALMPGVVKIIATSEGFTDTATVLVLSAPEPSFKNPVLFACVILPCREMVK